MTGPEGNVAAWLYALKRAVEAGYYRTETAVDEQSSFPWQGRTCADCPFWQSNECGVQVTERPANAHTCRYFDRPHREKGRARLHQRRWELLRGQ